MENYKIKVNNEAESKEAQELFFELGYFWNTGLGVKNLDAKFLYAKNNKITMGYCSDNFSDSGSKQLTLPQLRDLVVLHRNDPKDANVQQDGDVPCLYDLYLTEGKELYFYYRCKGKWIISNLNHDEDYYRILKPIQQPEQNLISGADAKLAWAKGENVQARPKTLSETWEDLSGKHSLDIFEQVISYEFRLKPRTITLNIEIPAPFHPKSGDMVWCLSELSEKGYEARTAYDAEDFIPHIAYWRTEEEIKQVVAALRGGIKG